MSKEEDYEAAFQHSKNNREEIMKSMTCGCYYCFEIFTPQQIEEWVPMTETPICPYCGIDTVIGSNSGLPLTREFLENAYEIGFGKDG